MKRIFDLTTAIVGVVVLSPLFALISLLVKIEDFGPVFYHGLRVGKNGTLFHIHKFRTMVIGAETLGADSTPMDDPRITRIGGILRQYKLDELPQFVNVLKGEMSLVGPRPQVQWAVDLYTDAERALLRVRPGITDYASLVFRNEATILEGSSDPDKDYLEKVAPEKIRLGLQYVSHHSLATDITILVATATTVLGVDPRWCLPCDARARR